MHHIPGPDFPTGGIIYGTDGIKEAYRNGRGIIKIRARVVVEKDKRTQRETIVVTELPYQVNKAKLVEKIASDQRVTLKVETPSEPLQANFDPDRISQVLLNLYLNAIEAMPAGGTLTLTLTQADDREGLVIRIGDTGCGIDPEDLNHMFDPYYTTKASGTGLGLAIVHNIVEAHGGDIRVASQPDQGTQISIFLPHRETPSAS